MAAPDPAGDRADGANGANGADGAGAVVALGGNGQRPARRKGRRFRRWRTGDWAVDLSCLAVVTMGFNQWRVGDYPLSDFIFVAVAGIVVLRLLTGRSRTLAPAAGRRSPTLVLVGSLIMLTAGALSSFGAWNPIGSIGVVLRLAWLTLIWFWVLRSVASTRAIFDRLLWAWWVALLINAFITVTGELGLTNFSDQNIEGRQTGFYGHANDLAGFLVVGLPLLVLGVPRREGSGPSTLLWRLAAIGLLGYALATTGSMSAIVGATIGVATTFAVIAITRDPKRRKRRHPLFVMVIVATLGIGLAFLTTSDLPLITRITELEQGGTGVNDSVEQRGVRNQYVLERLDELLVVGIGLDHDSLGKIANMPEGPATLDEIGVHNMYLKVFLESGLPGLIGLWIVIGAALVQAWRLMLNTRNETLHTTAAALFGSMVTINIFAMFQPTLYHRYYWYPVALTGALWSLRREELRRAERSPVPRRAPAPQVAPVAPV